jgi:putative restriction endonuclease
MAFGIFMHRADAIYDDVPAERYQFPKQYLSRAKQCEGDWIVYLEPSKVANTKGFFAVARVQEIIADPGHEGMYIAVIEPGSYLDFGDPVPFRYDGGYVERGVLNEHGRVSGRAQAAVRTISDPDFWRIIDLGLGDREAILPRVGEQGAQLVGFAEDQTAFETIPVRERVAQLMTRALRDRNFRKTVLRAYDARCAITGLKLINGGGRAEVEAAHIRPVERDGPDIVSNGLALSGTAHWMFDRGLVGVDDDHRILVSRQANDRDAVEGMINDSGKIIAPVRMAERPRLEFIRWHRENCFKH